MCSRRSPLPYPVRTLLGRAACVGLLCVALLLPLRAMAQAKQQPLDEVVDDVQRVYHETKDLTADFEQTYHFEVTGRSKKSSGRVYLKLPGKMRWDYLTPEPKHFVADGKMLWVIAPQDRQVMRQPLGQSDISSVLGFLMGSGDLRAQFVLTLLGQDAAGRHRLQLVPRADETHYRKVVLVIDPQSHRTVETEITDPAGNLNHLVFRNIKANQGLPDSGFSFEIPQGYRVIEAAAPASPAPSAEPPAGPAPPGGAEEPGTPRR